LMNRAVLDLGVGVLRRNFINVKSNRLPENRRTHREKKSAAH
jgi:hypothetical protein